MPLMDLFRSREEILRNMVETANKKNRDIAEPMDGSEFCRTYRKFYTRTLISGGLQKERLLFFDSRIRLALKCKRSVVALFCPEELADGYTVAFEEAGLCTQQAFPPVCFTDGSEWGFDPLLTDDLGDLASILSQVSAGLSGENHARSDFWLFVLELLKAAWGKPGLKEFLELDMHQLQQVIMTMGTDGTFSPMQSADFLQRYDPSLSAQAAGAGDLRAALKPLRACLREKNVGMDALARKQGLLFLDCLSAADQAPIDLIFALTRQAASESKRLVLAADCVGCSEHEKARARFFTETDASLPMLLGGDLPALMGPLFDRLAGNNALKVVFRQDSGISADKWAKAMGEYSKQIVEHAAGEGRSTAALFDRNNNHNLTIRTDEHAHRIPESTLRNLKAGQAVVRLPDIPTIQRVTFRSMSLTQLKEDLCCFVKNL